LGQKVAAAVPRRIGLIYFEPLGNTLYYEYGWYFGGAAIMLATIGLLALLRSRNSCTLRGARSQWKLLLTVLVSMIVVYVALYWATTWLDRAAT